MFKLIALILALIIPAAFGGEPGVNDPTRPSHLVAPARTTAVPAWHVESILISPERRVAVINGRSVGVGDWISGAQVREILPYEVRLDYKGEPRRAVLTGAQVKTEANPRAEKQ